MCYERTEVKCKISRESEVLTSIWAEDGALDSGDRIRSGRGMKRAVWDVLNVK